MTGKKRIPGRGPTPPAERRPGHPAQRRAGAAARNAQGRDPAAPARAKGGAVVRTGTRGAPRPGREDVETVVGRNPVVEALREGVPARALLLALGLEREPRLEEARTLAARRGVPIHEVPRAELDRLGLAHQGIGLQVPPYRYADPVELFERARVAPDGGLLVALDGVTDARNLGAVVRSTAAFAGQGVLVPERRSAGMTAGAWKSSAGAAARLPVARVTNLPRTLAQARDEGLLVVGLAATGELDLDDFELALEPLVLVVGSEGKGLSRLVGERCDLTLRIPLAGRVESLNAGVAAGIALAEVARRRRVAGRR